jgi:hypothetical protein
VWLLGGGREGGRGAMGWLQEGDRSPTATSAWLLREEETKEKREIKKREEERKRKEKERNGKNEKMLNLVPLGEKNKR